MINYIRNGAKILYNYALSLVVFAVFIYVFMTMTGENFENMLPLYSFLIFLLMFSIIYTDTKKLAIKEKRPQYDLHPYPLKGFLYGIVAVVPIFVLELVSVLISFNNDFSDRLKHLAVNTIMGPVYFVIRFLGEKPVGYIAATLVIPVVALLGYLAGFYGFDLIKRVKKDKEKPEAKAFVKSPWNPGNRTGSASGRKKKTKQTKSM